MNIAAFNSTSPRITECDFVLATDLDGTFLGGSAEDRARLYTLIEDFADRIGLIFVSGRDPSFIVDLCSNTPVPWPEYVIGDVGTTIAQVKRYGPTGRISPMAALEAEISDRWQDKGNAVRTALRDQPGLSVQETEFRYRVSYDLDPTQYCDSAEQKVADLGLDHLISDNRFFDVLPRGVSKGPSLLRLLDHLGIAQEKVLVAGDTLNDLSMLTTGLNAVAVGASEQPLLSALSGHPDVLRAKTPGAGGILEAMAHFNHLDHKIQREETDAV